MAEQLRILAIGAHPDDCDIKAGGVAIKYRALGHHVRFVSMTNGAAGHHEIGGIELARRRRAEAEAAGRVVDIEYHVLDHPDGELEPNLANRKTTIRLIRNYRPDLILTHRLNDYHPDHRYTSLLVQDASYLITVPNICTDTPTLNYKPVIAYMDDTFQRPYPLTADVAVDIDDVVEKKLDMLHCHTSQFYEWLAWHAGELEQVPADDSARRQWLGDGRMIHRFQDVADRHRSVLERLYGPQHSRKIGCAEAFEISEYGARADEAGLRRLFPFFPAAVQRTAEGSIGTEHHR